MFSLKKVAFTVSGVRNKSMRVASESNEAVRALQSQMMHAYDRNENNNVPKKPPSSYRRDFTTIEGVQGTLRPHVPIADAQRILEEAIEYSIHGPSIQGIQGGHDELADLDASLTDSNAGTDSNNDSKVIPENVQTYSCSKSINLHGCMQTNVPNPYAVQSGYLVEQLDHGTPQNMPGNGKKLYQKYVSGGRNDINYHKQSFHTSIQRHLQAANVPSHDSDNAFLERDPSPQGIQGDDCVQHKLWMETCLRYGLPNCDEQYQSIQSGRKTLAQVFAEQEEMVRNVAESYRKHNIGKPIPLDVDRKALVDMHTPEGIQGDNCVQFRLWLENCNRFGIDEHCMENLQALETGHKTLADIFAEQDRIIHSAAKDYQKCYTTSKANPETQEVGNKPSESDPPSDPNPSPNSEDSSPKSSGAKLKKAVAEYGSTVIVFHVGISLMSLGGFYVLVSRYILLVG